MPCMGNGDRSSAAATVDHTQLVRNLVRMHGGEPEHFHAMLDADGRICIRSPSSAAFYPQEAWLSKFTRHLKMG